MDFAVKYTLLTYACMKLTVIDNEVTANNMSIFPVPANVTYAFILSITVAYLNWTLNNGKRTNGGVIETAKIDLSFTKAFSSTC